jgi:sugar O-acyltransferase (sialic acid O-acetyltransferase NeuD family)
VVDDLIILGAGGTSREIADAVADINRQTRSWNLIGFLDDDPAKPGTTIDGVPVLGAIDTVGRYGAKVIVGIARAGTNRRRQEIAARTGLARDRFATIVHPAAVVSVHAKLGVGTAILANTTVTTGAIIGDHVIVHYNAVIAHDNVVGDFVTLAPGAICAGSVRLGKGAYLGAGCRIINDVSVGEGALVGMGAVVIRDVRAGATVVGNPAHELPAKRARAPG